MPSALTHLRVGRSIQDMRLHFILQDEGGQQIDAVFDAAGVLEPLLPLPDDHSYHCLRLMARHGDTLFDHLQIDSFLVELRRIRTRAQKPQDHALLDGIENLARRVHLTNRVCLKVARDIRDN